MIESPEDKIKRLEMLCRTQLHLITVSHTQTTLYHTHVYLFVAIQLSSRELVSPQRASLHLPAINSTPELFGHASAYYNGKHLSRHKLTESGVQVELCKDGS